MELGPWQTHVAHMDTLRHALCPMRLLSDCLISCNLFHLHLLQLLAKTAGDWCVHVRPFEWFL